MTVELRPGGVACNLGCTYCYQEPLRQATGNSMGSYDIDLMVEEAKKTGQNFSLFGGEALLIPIKDLEKLFKLSFEYSGNGSLQTNGSLITDKHIELFKKYNVSVGVSIDGPEELNDFRIARKNNSIENTRKHTQKTIDNIKKLRDNDIPVGIIVTVHRLNGIGEGLQKLKKFLRYLGDIGVYGGNIHVLEVDSTMPDPEKHVLTPEENVEAFLEIAEFLSQNKDLKWSPFNEMFSLLLANDKKATCFWKNCDPWNTQAVYGIEGDGALSNCGRTNKEGIDWYKADESSYARYVSLYHTPVDKGGCGGCRFWSVCGGSCPGEAHQGDFRNKTIHCNTQYAMLEYYESRIEGYGLVPFTKSDKLPLIEELLIDGLNKGKPQSLINIVNQVNKMLETPVIVPVKDNTNETTETEV